MSSMTPMESFGGDLQGGDAQVSLQENLPLPPIHRIPTELLYTIFEDALSGTEGVCRVRAALGLSHISRHLRNAAVGNPLLWSHIVLSGSLAKELCDMFLERSSSTNLYLTILYNDEKPSLLADIPGSDRLVSNVVDRLVAVTVQPSIIPTYPLGFYPDISLGVTHAVGTRKVSPTISMEFQSCVVTTLPTDSDGTCHLTSLKLVRSRFALKNTVHFPTLHTMELCLLQQEDNSLVERVLQDLPALETLTISGIGTGLSRMRHPLPLPSLKTLTLTCRSLLFGRSLLTSIQAPLLRNLTLGPGGLRALGFSEEPWEYGVPTLFEPLESFGWTGSTTLWDNVEFPLLGRDSLYGDAVRRLPNVTSHTINDPSGRSLKTMVKLSKELGATTILPCLQDLTVSYVDTFKIPPVPRLLLDFIQLREEAGLPLIQYLSIHIRNTGLHRSNATKEELEDMTNIIESIKSKVEWFELEGEETEQEIFFPRELDYSS
ncbi:hypothetical protein FRB90_006460 [Tulasnella sp. 427]|nr:hypothetical protein FRB90_006460 [Tulasnella sp. 427]